MYISYTRMHRRSSATIIDDRPMIAGGSSGSERPHRVPTLPSKAFPVATTASIDFRPQLSYPTLFETLPSSDSSTVVQVLKIHRRRRLYIRCSTFTSSTSSLPACSLCRFTPFTCFSTFILLCLRKPEHCFSSLFHDE